MSCARDTRRWGRDRAGLGLQRFLVPALAPTLRNLAGPGERRGSDERRTATASPFCNQAPMSACFRGSRYCLLLALFCFNDLRQNWNRTVSYERVAACSIGTNWALRDVFLFIHGQPLASSARIMMQVKPAPSLPPGRDAFTAHHVTPILHGRSSNHLTSGASGSNVRPEHDAGWPERMVLPGSVKAPVAVGAGQFWD